ncbi:unnamed protein product, partial [Heterosigma akashiwo]
SGGSLQLLGRLSPLLASRLPETGVSCDLRGPQTWKLFGARPALARPRRLPGHW